MTDPTTTRAEVEAFSPYVGWDAVPTMKLDADLGRWVRLSDYAALRERAEAAERHKDAGWDQQRYWSDRYVTKTTALEAMLRQAEDDLTAARRAEAAAWNDAIEAISDDDLIAAMMAIEEMELQDRWFEKWRGTMDGWKGEHFGDCTNAPISCLRCAYEAARERLPGFKGVLRALRRAAPTEGEA